MRDLTVKKNEDDAGKAAFAPETHHSLTTLRHRLGHWLNAKSPTPATAGMTQAQGAFSGIGEGD